MTSQFVEHEPRVTIDQENQVLLIGLNRASKRNAFDMAMFEQLYSAYTELEKNDQLRCGILYAHGEHFTAGLDLGNVIPVMQKHGCLPRAHGTIDPWGLTAPLRTKPLVCAVQGYCFTLGIELMLAADIVIAASNTRFAQIEIKRGIFPFGGATIRMVQTAGWGNAMRYLLTGDEFGAEEARSMGLVQEIVEPGQQLHKAMAIAQTIAAQAPLGVRATIESARKAILEGQQAAIDELLPAVLKLMNTEDANEGMRSFIEHRPAHFVGK